MLRSTRNTVVVLLVALLLTGCAKYRGSGVPGSPYEQVMAYNAALAEANHEIATGVIAAQRTNVFSVSLAENILNVQFQIAKYDKQLSEILKLGPEVAKGRAAEIQILLNALQKSADAIIVMKLGDSPQAAEVMAQSAAVKNFAVLIAQQLQKAGVLQ